MRRSLYAAIAVTLAVALVMVPTAIAQQGEQEQKTIEGSLKSIDLQENKIVIQQSDETEVTLVLTEETKVQTPEGEAPIAALEGKEGSALMAHFVQHDESNVCLSIVLVTN